MSTSRRQPRGGRRNPFRKVVTMVKAMSSTRKGQGSGLPFYLVHLSCILVFFVDFTWGPWSVSAWRCSGCACSASPPATTATSRTAASRPAAPFQFVLALLGTLAVQKGVLWWAAHHRVHHKYSDQEGDVHSPGAARLLVVARRLDPRPELRGDRPASASRDLAEVPRAALAERPLPGAAGRARRAAVPRRRLRPGSCGASSSARRCSGTGRSRSTRSRTSSAAAATRPPTTAATTSGSR